MKTIYKSLIFGAALILGMSSCVNNLNTTPIDPNVIQTFDQDAVYYKILASFVATGQVGGGGDADIITDDEGYSGFYRTLCVLNEFPTDAGWWTWRNDAGCSDLLKISWTSSNPFVSKLYNRLNYGVTMCNHFLDNTTGATDEKTKKQRAEVRFVRAINYYHLLDMFGNVPFTVSMSDADEKNPPKQILRAELYQWLLDEILTGHAGKSYKMRTGEEYSYAASNIEDADHGFVDDLVNKAATTIYCPNKEAANLLAARLYLNAEVYSGTPAWDKAEEYAQKVVDAFPVLFKPYWQIFCGDNDRVAASEFVFAAACDGAYIRSYAGSQYTVCCTRIDNMNSCGSTNGTWGCWRSTPELIEAFFPNATLDDLQGIPSTDTVDVYIQEPKYLGDETVIPVLAGDDRALFANQVVKDTTVTFDTKFLGVMPDNGEGFQFCWGICKWTNIYHDGTQGGSDAFWCDTDVPLMRASEAYLTLAEAQMRQGKATALGVVNTVRARANAAPLPALTEDDMLDEWLREFYHEGRRRIDLIRFGQFVGPTANRHWEGRGCPSGTETEEMKQKYASYPFVTVKKMWQYDSKEKKYKQNGTMTYHVGPKNPAALIDAHYALYPIPNTDVVANPNLEQNQGY